MRGPKARLRVTNLEAPSETREGAYSRQPSLGLASDRADSRRHAPAPAFRRRIRSGLRRGEIPAPKGGPSAAEFSLARMNLFQERPTNCRSRRSEGWKQSVFGSSLRLGLIITSTDRRYKIESSHTKTRQPSSSTSVS